MNQLDGLVAGYNQHSHSVGVKSLNFHDLFLLNMVGDLDDLIPAMNLRLGKTISVEDHIKWVVENSHCSCLVKPTAKELFAGHEMWASYYQMLNVYKHYNFKLKNVPAGRVSFSSYPALLSSEDDFYILNTGLVVMETTNGIFNMSIYESITPQSLMSWIRAIVSNRMTTSGKEWTTMMAKYNSGTYNNQWMVVDFKRYVAGSTTLAPGTLWIGSQLPSYFESADVTHVVNKQGYWPSYNIPYFENVFNMAGYPSMVAQFGNYWSYHGYPRSQIFKQREGSVKDLASMQRLMRYNDYQNDPLSMGCPDNQIACRADLAVANRTSFCSAGAFGAINAKITSSSRVPEFEAVIIGGPTHQTLPPFEWTTEIDQRFGVKHYGQPKRFDFRWQFVKPTI